MFRCCHSLYKSAFSGFIHLPMILRPTPNGTVHSMWWVFQSIEKVFSFKESENRRNSQPSLQTIRWCNHPMKYLRRSCSHDHRIALKYSVADIIGKHTGKSVINVHNHFWKKKMLSKKFLVQMIFYFHSLNCSWDDQEICCWTVEIKQLHWLKSTRSTGGDS